MDNKQLQVIVKESGLQKTEAEEILETFNNIFALVGEWEKEAFDINITHESQIVDMQRAGVGRKVIQRVRLDLESASARKRILSVEVRLSMQSQKFTELFLNQSRTILTSRNITSKSKQKRKLGSAGRSMRKSRKPNDFAR